MVRYIICALCAAGGWVCAFIAGVQYDLKAAALVFVAMVLANVNIVLLLDEDEEDDSHVE